MNLNTNVRKTCLTVCLLAAAAALVACGGGFESAAPTEPLATELVDAGTAVAPSIHILGGSNGVVARQLAVVSASRSEAEAQVIIIDSTQLAGIDRDRVKHLVDGGKTVVFDGAEGSDNAQKATQSVLGFAIEGEALMIARSPDGEGYSVTPIDSEASSTKRIASATANGATARTINTVSSVFGL